MLEPERIDRLEKRAGNAVNGYGSDVNITPYVYGQDVCDLLNERRELLIELGKWRMLAEEREKKLPGVYPTAPPEPVKEETPEPAKGKKVRA